MAFQKRHKYRGMNFAFSREFDVAPDQQAILRQIEGKFWVGGILFEPQPTLTMCSRTERVKNATQSQPYNRTTHFLRVIDFCLSIFEL
jgi:hypothetical protein